MLQKQTLPNSVLKNPSELHFASYYLKIIFVKFSKTTVCLSNSYKRSSWKLLIDAISAFAASSFSGIDLNGVEVAGNTVPRVSVPSSLERSVWWWIANPLAKSGELLKWQHPSCSCCFSLPSLGSCLSSESLSGGMEEHWRSSLLCYAVWPDTRQRNLHFPIDKAILIADGRFQMFMRCSVFWKQDMLSEFARMWLMQ